MTGVIMFAQVFFNVFPYITLNFKDLFERFEYYRKDNIVKALWRGIQLQELIPKIHSHNIFVVSEHKDGSPQ